MRRFGLAIVVLAALAGFPLMVLLWRTANALSRTANALHFGRYWLALLLGVSSVWSFAPALVLAWVWLGTRERPGYRHPGKAVVKGFGVFLLAVWLGLIGFSQL